MELWSVRQQGGRKIAFGAGRVLLRSGLLLLLAVAVPGQASAQAAAASPVVPPAAAQEGERFSLQVPKGWKLVNRASSGPIETVSYVPDGQSAERWQDMLTVQVVRSAAGAQAPSPDQLYAQSQSSYEQACDGVKLGALQRGKSNGYPSAFWVLGCAKVRSAGYGETAFFRTIQGTSGLYMAQWAWRVAPFDTTEGPPLLEDQQKEALTTLQSFQVCDPSNRQHPCQPGQ